MEHRPYIWIDEPDADAHVRFFRLRRRVFGATDEQLASSQMAIQAHILAAQKTVEPQSGFFQAVLHGAAGALRL